ncbi:hypothetical protein Bpfe_004381 [Biomphalaria pfeifferi]|uniref:Uncharacterized protein n=1 Tax=Biomphalaria pfeifferi TaxID=112525 RepID=A0AAD8FJ60_BIOPF|nr:hypothetical protein Bpfe_004381 [Biomphalaria pfeifferi]
MVSTPLGHSYTLGYLQVVIEKSKLLTQTAFNRILKSLAYGKTTEVAHKRIARRGYGPKLKNIIRQMVRRSSASVERNFLDSYVICFVCVCCCILAMNLIPIILKASMYGSVSSPSSRKSYCLVWERNSFYDRHRIADYVIENDVFRY